jgi:hypothetical protein
MYMKATDDNQKIGRLGTLQQTFYISEEKHGYRKILLSISVCLDPIRKLMKMVEAVRTNYKATLMGQPALMYTTISTSKYALLPLESCAHFTSSFNVVYYAYLSA